jgi:hypothetical protein
MMAWVIVLAALLAIVLVIRLRSVNLEFKDDAQLDEQERKRQLKGQERERQKRLKKS